MREASCALARSSGVGGSSEGPTPAYLSSRYPSITCGGRPAKQRRNGWLVCRVGGVQLEACTGLKGCAQLGPKPSTQGRALLSWHHTAASRNQPQPQPVPERRSLTLLSGSGVPSGSTSSGILPCKHGHRWGPRGAVGTRVGCLQGDSQQAAAASCAGGGKVEATSERGREAFAGCSELLAQRMCSWVNVCVQQFFRAARWGLSARLADDLPP